MDIYTCTYQYVPVHTSIYYPYLNFAFFDFRHHPIISPAREMHAVAINSRSASWMYEKPSCLVSCTYQYVPVRTGHLFLYWSVPVCTCTYRYIPVRTILPDPVQVYRIPDVTFILAAPFYRVRSDEPQRLRYTALNGTSPSARSRQPHNSESSIRVPE